MLSLLSLPCPLVNHSGRGLCRHTGSCDEADCSTLCPNREDVTHFRERGVVAVVHFPTAAPTAPCDAALSQSPWEGKQAASRLFLSKKLCNHNLKKHIKTQFGQISNNCNQIPFHITRNSYKWCCFCSSIWSYAWQWLSFDCLQGSFENGNGIKAIWQQNIW